MELELTAEAIEKGFVPPFKVYSRQSYHDDFEYHGAFDKAEDAINAARKIKADAVLQDPPKVPAYETRVVDSEGRTYKRIQTSVASNQEHFYR